ncbi:fatty acid--CoA ligase [Delftia sp. PS-11]|uniref:fatty acid--CoA ligase n=1 Tax=Delftia sp. PS-11 TaxID=2767222 RepID=UPI00245712AF|nr:fatty acid--CoA ligase [Delftia sp. PS-11]KAJ8738175.1 fatty acid--CoA ligase [Delftia sp. PS-11]
MQQTLGDTLAWPARYLSDKPALVAWEGHCRRAWTYAQLDAEVNRHAHGLASLGIGHGDVVAGFLYNTPAFVFTMLAAARLGAIFNPVNYRLAPQELAFILQDGGARALVFESEGGEVAARAQALLKAQGAGCVEHWIFADDSEADALPAWATQRLSALARGRSSAPARIAVRENDACILMYTSGTTGRPKGVLHTHRSKLAHNALMHQTMQFTRDDVGLAMAPLNHTAELHTSFLPRLQVGATQVLLRRFDVDEAWRLIREERVTFFFAAPTMITMLLNHPLASPAQASALRLVEYGGASMAPHLIREWTQKVGCDLVQVYGTTEMGPCMSILLPREQLSHAGSAGLPSMGHDLIVARVREDNAPTDPADACLPGEVGEILVRGPCMMAGYLHRPDANARALAHGWYHTGDLGHIDEDGYLWIRDRIDYMINSGAENVYPREVEDALVEHPDVLEVAVIGEADERWGQVVAAHMVARPGAAPTSEVLDAFLVHGDRLAAYKRPRRYHFRDALPKTASGKIQKQLLRMAG